VEAVARIAGQQAECGGAQQPESAVGLAAFPLGELSGAETAVGEMLGEVEIGDRSHEPAAPEAGDHPNHAPVVRTRGQLVAAPGWLSFRHPNAGGSVVERSMAHVQVDPIDKK
jgi:hypothetical protein